MSNKYVSYTLFILALLIIPLALFFGLMMTFFMFDSPNSSDSGFKIIFTLIKSITFIWIYPIILIVSTKKAIKFMKNEIYEKAIKYLFLGIFTYPLIILISTIII